jgi:hypothetical protein
MRLTALKAPGCAQVFLPAGPVRLADQLLELGIEVAGARQAEKVDNSGRSADRSIKGFLRQA